MRYIDKRGSFIYDVDIERLEAQMRMEEGVEYVHHTEKEIADIMGYHDDDFIEE